MGSQPVWIVGATRSGKTTRLVELLQARTASSQPPESGQVSPSASLRSTPPILVLAANGDNRLVLTDRLDGTIGDTYPLHCTTPLGFFLDEAVLFWPIILEKLHLKAQFPLRLRPETEQELATRLWRSRLDDGTLSQEGVNEYRLVRRTLDLLQLAGTAGISSEDIPLVLEASMPEEQGSPALWQAMGEAIVEWRDWCGDRGLLTYGIACEYYWKYILPDPLYQERLLQRYAGIWADDTDEYPAITRDLFEFFLDRDRDCVFTFNPNGGVRLGLNADPDYIAELAARCRVEVLPTAGGLQDELGELAVQLALDPMFFAQLPPSVDSIQTTARSQLLRQTAEAIVSAVKSGSVEPGEIAVIAPGMDAIARYTLSEILDRHGIATYSLNLQEPLIGSPPIRALLTLLALVYPGLGQLIDRDAVAEMLVLLSAGDTQETGSLALTFPIPYAIDPVRAGLIADRCYVPHPDNPQLLPVTEFARWDRLGYRATAAYEGIVRWLTDIQVQLASSSISSPVSVLERAIDRFLWRGGNLAFDRLADLRELLETAQHYWEVADRIEGSQKDDTTTLRQFIELLRRGTVTANPSPLRPLVPPNAVTLANIFQYRTARQSHRWHFWLDVSSPLWSRGGAAVLFGAPSFLHRRTPQRRWTLEDEILDDERRLRCILLDLLGRSQERVILCHSDVDGSGGDRLGSLLALVNASVGFSPVGV
ncbi:MAG: recombinase family protein [Cyanobacteria bacterium J055]|nr:MAG: recombinase family protein [Cyanobacteria bacterium J055]